MAAGRRVRFGLAARQRRPSRRGAGLTALGRAGLLCLAIASPTAFGAEAPVGRLANAHLIATPPMPQPGYLAPTMDPTFGTSIVRVTDPGQTMGRDVTCDLAYCTHRYSSAQAWNADQSLLLIVNGCNGLCFLDGKTYRPLFRRTMPNECEWHPTDPALMICMRQNFIFTWAPRTNAYKIVYTDPDHSRFRFGPYKGNPSRDGHRVAVRAFDASDQEVVFAYDLAAGKKFPDIRLATMEGKTNSCTISPSGLYVLCSQNLPDDIDQIHIFTVDGEKVQYWSEHHRPGHGDMTIDTDGSDVYVGISKSEPDPYHIIKRRLSDGLVTDLAPYGEGQHASLRNVNRPGWVFLSYGGTHAELSEQPSWAQFYQEVIALKIDGSGEFRRIVQTRNAKNDYWSETHASPSPDGSQVIWSSNWGQPGAPVADYVSRIDWNSPPSPRQAQTPGPATR
jgi:hypothetical protein